MKLRVVLVSGLAAATTAFSPVTPIIMATTSHNRIIATTLRGGAVSADPKKTAFLVGNISDALKTLYTRSGSALHRSADAFRLTDIEVILILAFLPEVVLRFINNLIVNKTIRKKNPLDFESTPYLSRLSVMLCQMGQLGLYVYFGELFIVFLRGLGVPQLSNKPKLLASTVYGVYAAKLLSETKSRLLDRAFRQFPNRIKLASRKTLYNRVLDFAIYLVMTLLFLDFNKIDVGVAMASLLTLGGVSSIVVGLALKEPVTEIIQGTSVLLSDKFNTGDVIRLSDGTSGQVQDLRWTDITMRGSDNSFVRIPHSQIAKTRIVNLSRMPNSQVSQSVRLANRGTTQIKRLLENIKGEIKSSCPKLIDDMSQPFRVHWTDMESNNNIVITIECHFRIARLCNEYWENRQEVLMAISRAVEEYNKENNAV